MLLRVDFLSWFDNLGDDEAEQEEILMVPLRPGTVRVKLPKSAKMYAHGKVVPDYVTVDEAEAAAVEAGAVIPSSLREAGGIVVGGEGGAVEGEGAGGHQAMGLADAQAVNLQEFPFGVPTASSSSNRGGGGGYSSSRRLGTASKREAVGGGVLEEGGVEGVDSVVDMLLRPKGEAVDGNNPEGSLFVSVRGDWTSFRANE